jgi:hypothetical protein
MINNYKNIKFKQKYFFFVLIAAEHYVMKADSNESVLHFNRIS